MLGGARQTECRLSYRGRYMVNKVFYYKAGWRRWGTAQGKLRLISGKQELRPLQGQREIRAEVNRFRLGSEEVK